MDVPLLLTHPVKAIGAPLVEPRRAPELDYDDATIASLRAYSVI